MAGRTPQEAIELFSSDEEVPGDDGADNSSWSDDDAPRNSDSDSGDLFPPVEAAVGDEDDESDEDADVEVQSSTQPPQRSATPDTPNMPNLPRRQPYVMDHTAASLPIAVGVSVPSAFASAGITESAHFNQWLQSLSDPSVRAPPYSEHMSGLHAANAFQLQTSLQREAVNLHTWRQLLARSESEILETDRLRWIIARMSTSPLMRAAAAVQGADLRLPETLLNRAAAPPPNLTYRPPGSANNEAEPSSSTASSRPALESGASSTRPQGKALADVRPVTFGAPDSDTVNKLPSSGALGMAEKSQGAGKPSKVARQHTTKQAVPTGGKAGAVGTSGAECAVAGPSGLSKGSTSSSWGNAIAGPSSSAAAVPLARPSTSSSVGARHTDRHRSRARAADGTEYRQGDRRRRSASPDANSNSKRVRRDY
ncbi:unnamed protein product [Peniophora sp. CBMAI 1063]|nr:unnamed protein product [Peniophora sp. CBMAI 1063]